MARLSVLQHLGRVADFCGVANDGLAHTFHCCLAWLGWVPELRGEAFDHEVFPTFLFLRVSSRCLAPSALRFLAKLHVTETGHRSKCVISVGMNLAQAVRSLPRASRLGLQPCASALRFLPCASRLSRPAVRFWASLCALALRGLAGPGRGLAAPSLAAPPLPRLSLAAPALAPRLRLGRASSGRALSGRVPLLLCCPAYGLPVGKEIAESLPTFAFLMFASASRPSSSPALKLHTVVPKRRPPGLLPFRAAAP
jgi:hypothetical protein